MLHFLSTRSLLSSVFLSSLFLTFTIGVSMAQQNTQNPELMHFDNIATYLTQGSGQWKAPNNNHNPNNPRSAKAFGLWFKRPMRNLMTLKIVSYQKDTILTSSEGIFSWHPGEKQFIHVNGNRGNGYSEGITAFPSDSMFISTVRIFTARGSSYEHKDENFIVNDNIHRNVSYRKDEEGEWIAESEWTWTRIPEK